MLLTITLLVSILIIINLILLKFSVNKIDKTTRKNKQPIVLNPSLTIASKSEKLAPTGS